MEEFLDAVTGGALWGVGFGVALTAVQAAGTGLRPVAKGAMRGAMNFGDWLRDVSAEARENVQDTYHEARAEMQAEHQRHAAAEPRTTSSATKPGAAA